MSETKAPEQRTATVDVAEVQTEGRKLTGFAALYGIESRDLGGFTETVQRGAFSDVLASDPDVYLTFNHSPDKVLARTSSETLRLSDEERGLAFEADLGDGPTAQDVREMVKRGDVSGASFRFVVADEDWEGDRRTVTKIAELIDLSLATMPAYNGPRVELRTSPTTSAADGPQKEVEMTEETKTEERQEAPEEKAEARVISEPAPVLQAEDRGGPQFVSLTDEFRSAGFPGEVATISADTFRAATESRAATFGGTIDVLNQQRVSGVPLGYDQRYAWQVPPQVSVSAGATSVEIFQQTDRTLVAGTTVIRNIDAVTNKPETSSTLSVLTVPLKQVASIQSGVPNVYLERAELATVVEQDLRHSVDAGLDELVRAGLATSGNQSPGTDELLVSIRKAITTLRAAGYSPDTIALTPAASEELDVLVTGESGATNAYVFGAAQFAPGTLFGLRRIESKVITWPVVWDSTAHGKLYLSPISLARFEENAGKTNTSLVRLEGHAAYGVERAAAAVRIASS